MSQSPIHNHVPESYRPELVPKALKVVYGGGKSAEEKSKRADGSSIVDTRIFGKCRVTLPAGEDLENAANWYKEVFQLPAYTVTGEDSIMLQLPVGSQTIVLRRTGQSAPGLNVSLQGTRHPIVTLNVDNIDSLHDRILAHGGSSLMKPCDLFFRMAMFQDPYGNCLSILQEPPGWSAQIGRAGKADTLDWVKIPVFGSLDKLIETRDWYEANLGLTPGELTKEEDGVDLHPGNLHLQLVDAGTPARVETGKCTIPFLYLETNDLESMHRMMKEKGIRVEEIEMIEGSARSFSFTDPNENVIGILQPS